MKTDVLPKIDEEVTESDGNAHWVRIRSLIAGGPVVALCGKKYVPKEIAKAADRPMCKSCDELYHLLEMME